MCGTCLQDPLKSSSIYTNSIFSFSFIAGFTVGCVYADSSRIMTSVIWKFLSLCFFFSPRVGGHWWKNNVHSSLQRENLNNILLGNFFFLVSSDFISFGHFPPLFFLSFVLKGDLKNYVSRSIIRCKYSLIIICDTKIFSRQRNRCQEMQTIKNEKNSSTVFFFSSGNHFSMKRKSTFVFVEGHLISILWLKVEEFWSGKNLKSKVHWNMKILLGSLRFCECRYWRSFRWGEIFWWQGDFWLAIK